MSWPSSVRRVVRMSWPGSVRRVVRTSRPSNALRGRVYPGRAVSGELAGPYALTGRDQAGAVPVTRHRARYSGIGGVYGSLPSGRWISSGSSGVSGTTAPVA